MLASTIAGSPAVGVGGHGAAGSITSNLGANIGFTDFITNNAGDESIITPKAYLNIIFFDERFNFIAESSTSKRVLSSGDNVAPLDLFPIQAPKNGYCYIYISNESAEPVFFDNLKIRHDRARIIEENHYYAYGLKIAAISSKAYGAPNNNYGYQGDFNEFDDDLGWNDFELRSYDPQTGRFLQNDPYDQFASGYVGMGNDPVNGVDPSGGIFIPGMSLAAASGGFGSAAASLGNTAVVSGSLAKVGAKAAAAGLKAVIPTAAVAVANSTLKSLKIKTGTNTQNPSDGNAVLRKPITVEIKKGQGNSLSEVTGAAEAIYDDVLLPVTHWINVNINPVYGAFNGVNSQFTHEDFLTGEPMTNAGGGIQLGFAFMPGGGLVKGAAKSTQKLAFGAYKSVAQNVGSNAAKGGAIIKQSSKKADYLLANRNDAMNWARKQLGHNTDKMYDAGGKWIGWSNSKGSVYWGHGDWGKGVGSSTFPHLNYNIGSTKGHLFLQDKITNRGMMGDFTNYFGL